MSSVQLRAYLRARADGSGMTTAAAVSGLGIAEARLTEAAIAKGELQLPTIHHEEGAPAMPKTEEPTAANTDGDEQFIELAADTLRGDCRDAALSWIKTLQKPWSAMSEEEQRDLAQAADRFASNLVKQACQIIAAGERPTIVAKLVEYKEKDGVEAKLKLPSTGEVVAALHEACGREVLLVATGHENFAGEAGEAQIDADQPGIPGIGEEYDEAA